MADPELVIDTALEPPLRADALSMLPRVNSTSLVLLDEAVDRIATHVKTFTCTSARDYELGAAQIAGIRKLDTLYKSVFKPMKAWWNEQWDKTNADETKRTGPLGQAKDTYWRVMQDWKSAEDRKTAALLQQQRALEVKRAEEARLAQAEQIAERAKVTGNEKLAQAAVDLLDRPLDIAPVQVTSSVPRLTGSGVSVARRKTVVAQHAYARLKALADSQQRRLTDDEWNQATEIKGTDLEDLIISVAASLLLKREPLDVGVRDFLRPLATPIQDAQHVVKTIDAAWIRREFANRGDTFKLGGVAVVLKEGLG